MLRRRTQDDEDVHVITQAPRPHSDEMDQRIGRYLVSMAIRTACVVLVFVVPGPTKWAFAVGAVFLPYIAVIMANAGYTRTVRRYVPSRPEDPAPARPDS